MPEQKNAPFVFNAERNAQQIETLKREYPGMDVTHTWTGEQLAAIAATSRKPTPEMLKKIEEDAKKLAPTIEDAEDETERQVREDTRRMMEEDNARKRRILQERQQDKQMELGEI